MGELRKAVERLETEIDQHEQAIKQEEAELLQITKDGFNDRAAELSRSLSKRKKAIDQLFEQLEARSSDLAAKDRVFLERLAALQ